MNLHICIFFGIFCIFLFGIFCIFEQHIFCILSIFVCIFFAYFFIFFCLFLHICLHISWISESSHKCLLNGWPPNLARRGDGYWFWIWSWPQESARIQTRTASYDPDWSANAMSSQRSPAYGCVLPPASLSPNTQSAHRLEAFIRVPIRVHGIAFGHLMVLPSLQRGEWGFKTGFGYLMIDGVWGSQRESSTGDPSQICYEKRR